VGSIPSTGGERVSEREKQRQREKNSYMVRAYRKDTFVGVRGTQGREISQESFQGQKYPSWFYWNEKEVARGSGKKARRAAAAGQGNLLMGTCSDFR
jgi:hypothetical protein